MHSMNRKAHLNIVQIILDTACIFCSFFLTGAVVRHITEISEIPNYLWIPILFGIVYLFIMFAEDMYMKTTFMYQDRMLRNLCISSIAASIFCFVMIPYVKTAEHRFEFLCFYILITVIVLAVKYAITYEVRRSVSGRYSAKTLMVGTSEKIMEYLYFLQKTSMDAEIIGCITLDDLPGNIECKKLGEIKDFNEILKNNIIDEVVFAIPKDKSEQMEPYVRMCEERGLTVKITVELYEFSQGKCCVHSMGTIPVLTYHTVNINGFKLFAKRIFDIVVSIIGVVLLAIASVVFIPVILIESGRPVFDAKYFIGLNGRRFKTWQFRVFKTNQNSGPLHERRTFTGKILHYTGIEYWPQFISVLKGDMSIVGCIPTTWDRLAGLKNSDYRHISIKPGMTGIWKICKNKGINKLEELIQYEKQYIDTWTFSKDLLLFIKNILLYIKIVFSFNARKAISHEADFQDIMKDMPSVEQPTVG